MIPHGNGRGLTRRPGDGQPEWRGKFDRVAAYLALGVVTVVVLVRFCVTITLTLT
ncbi:hypothetical protein [Sphaerisporangium fuscum]|uniref:hypothetical protein n=1 Tax=Sphaerisporangium fuscum TaxID=2835868 RepID=UPI001BDC3364|nr:hypothetical protein [Sphaerisporangium fuscum]